MATIALVLTLYINVNESEAKLLQEEIRDIRPKQSFVWECEIEQDVRHSSLRRKGLCFSMPSSHQHTLTLTPTVMRQSCSVKMT
jgi:hypothetical protein